MWFKVSRWSDEVTPKVFAKETEHRLYRINPETKRLTSFEEKQTSYHQWFPTREEAEAFVVARGIELAEKKRLARIHEDAVPLRDALVELRFVVVAGALITAERLAEIDALIARGAS